MSALTTRRTRTAHGARRTRTILRTLARASALAVMLTACGGASDPGSLDDAAAEGDFASGTLTVFAAASLTDTFEQLADEFSTQHAGVDVQLSFAGSSDLVTQIQEGAPADVLATADERTMQQLVNADGVAADPQVFVSNTLVIAAPAGNPEGIEGLEDLTDEGLDLVVCAPQVPCGAAAETVAEAAGLTLSPVSEEPAVTDVLGKVANGQADAGLVYRTDAAGSDDVDGIEFPESEDAVNLYPIAPVADSENAELAEAFASFILSDDAREVFDAAGFAVP